MKRQLRQGFTLIELLVVVAIIALLIAILIPSLGRAKELANRATCSANLHGIMQSMILYAAEQQTGGGGYLPCVANLTGGTTYSTGLSVATPNASATTAAAALADMQTGTTGVSHVAGSPTAGLWMLVLRGQTPPKQFICKSDSVGGGPVPAIESVASSNAYYEDFGATNISYGVAYPWTSSHTAGPWFKDNSDSTCPYLSDMPPAPTNIFSSVAAAPQLAYQAGAVPASYNSPNHSGAGQNVVYGDVHVVWQGNPECGTTPAVTNGTADNIFTASNLAGPDGGGSAAGAGTITAAIQTTATAPFDIVIVPQRLSGGGTQ